MSADFLRGVATAVAAVGVYFGAQVVLEIRDEARQARAASEHSLAIIAGSVGQRR